MHWIVCIEETPTSTKTQMRKKFWNIEYCAWYAPLLMKSLIIPAIYFNYLKKIRLLREITCANWKICIDYQGGKWNVIAWQTYCAGWLKALKIMTKSNEKLINFRHILCSYSGVTITYTSGISFILMWREVQERRSRGMPTRKC